MIFSSCNCLFLLWSHILNTTHSKLDPLQYTSFYKSKYCNSRAHYKPKVVIRLWSTVDNQINMFLPSPLLLVVAFATMASCHGETCKFRCTHQYHRIKLRPLHIMICLISQLNSAPDIFLVTARRYTTVAAPPQECTPLTQVVVDPSRCTVIWTVSGRSSRGE